MLMLSISIIIGLAAMVSWGFADFLQSTIIRKIGTFKTIFLGNLLGLLFIIPFLFLKDSMDIALPNIILLILFGGSQLIAMKNFYDSMNIGEIAIVTPISASYPLVSVILMIFFLGARLSGLSLIAIFVLVIGIILTSTDLRKLKKLHEAKGVKESLIAMSLWGIYFFIIDIVSNGYTFFGITFPETNYMAVFVFSTLINGIYALIYAILKKGIPDRNELKKAVFVIILTTLIYTAAWIAITYGMVVGQPSIITPISSLYPMICVILAVLFYKEKLVLNQKIGIITIFAGLVLISI